MRCEDVKMMMENDEKKFRARSFSLPQSPPHMYRPSVCIPNTSSAVRAFVAMLCKRVNKKATLQMRAQRIAHARDGLSSLLTFFAFSSLLLLKRRRREEKMGKLNQERSFTALRCG